jgi:hypothetical protein
MYDQLEKDVRGEETHALDNLLDSSRPVDAGFWLSRRRRPHPPIARVRGGRVGL